MTNSFITQLTCQGNITANKKFVVNENNEIIKLRFRIGKVFAHKQIPVNCFSDLIKVLEKAQDEYGTATL